MRDHRKRQPVHGAAIELSDSVPVVSQEAVISLTVAGAVTGWDAAAERLFGCPAASAIGRPFITLVPVALQDAVGTLLEAVRRGGRGTVTGAAEVSGADGAADISLGISPVRDGAGAIIATVVVARGLSQCTRVEVEPRAAEATALDANRALQESEDRFRGAFDAAPIGMALVATDGRFLQVNRVLCGIVGFSEDELLTRTFQDITHPDDRDVDRESVRQLLLREIESYQIEKRYLCREGREICGRLTVSLVRDQADEPLYFIAQIQDITPYKVAGAALREAEARYRSLVEQIPAVVYVDAPDTLGTPRYVSPRIEALFGYTPEEWLADHGLWLGRLHPDDRDRVLATIAAASESGEPITIDYRAIARDGNVVWVHDEVVLLRDEDGARKYWQGFMVDITDRKLAEEELRAAKEAAEEANRLKSSFLSMATHELRTPLTIISGYVELLAESANVHLSPEEREFLDIAQTSTRTLTSLVDDLLDLARIEAGRLELAIRAVDVAETVERVRRMVAAQAAAKGIGLDVKTEPDLSRVAADPNRLVQILLNLIGNAIKFTESGFVVCAIRPVAQGVAIDVTDTGIGIDPAAIPRIFDEFRQADAGTTRKFGGSGLGLAIAKRLIELQGGTIAVESRVGLGSTFTLWLPAAEASLVSDESASWPLQASPLR